MTVQQARPAGAVACLGSPGSRPALPLIRPPFRQITGESPEKSAVDHAVLTLLQSMAIGATRQHIVRTLFKREASVIRNAKQWKKAKQARALFAKRASRAVQRSLERLRYRGHIEPTVHATLTDVTREAIDRRGFEALVDRAHVEVDGEIVGVVAGEEVGEGTHARRIIEALYEHGSLEPGELCRMTGGLTASGNESGAWRRALRAWTDGGDVEAAGLWRLTDAGRAALEEST